jgi:hypothetical protein
MGYEDHMNGQHSEMVRVVYGSTLTGTESQTYGSVFEVVTLTQSGSSLREHFPATDTLDTPGSKPSATA